MRREPRGVDGGEGGHQGSPLLGPCCAKAVGTCSCACAKGIRPRAVIGHAWEWAPGESTLGPMSWCPRFASGEEHRHNCARDTRPQGHTGGTKCTMWRK